MHSPSALNKHFIRKYATDAKVDGVRVTVYCFSCTPCNINGKTYATKSARDKRAEEHVRE
jgi:hypothetical protein